MIIIFWTVVIFVVSMLAWLVIDFIKFAMENK